MGGFSPVVNLAEKVGVVKKSAEQPKVQSQMSAPKPLATPTGPTTIEAGLTKGKRSGRKYAQLTSSTGVSGAPELELKTLLGG